MQNESKKERSQHKKTVNEMRFQFPSLSVNESVARGAVAVFCAQLDPSATEIADVKCAVSEAVTNSIVHAYRDAIGIIYIKAQIYEENKIKIEIKDRGCGIPDVKQARQPLYTTDAAGERSGMGFTVMESFMDGLRVSSTEGKGTTVTMYRQLSERESL